MYSPPQQSSHLHSSIELLVPSVPVLPQAGAQPDDVDDDQEDDEDWEDEEPEDEEEDEEPWGDPEPDERWDVGGRSR